MALPPVRKRPKSGIRREADREWDKHRKFVRRHQCVAPGCMNAPIRFAHVRSAANAGGKLKPFDWFGVSMCDGHHQEQHDHGAETFMAKYRVDLWALAGEFATKSPDLEMKAAMQEWGHANMRPTTREQFSKDLENA